MIDKRTMLIIVNSILLIVQSTFGGTPNRLITLDQFFEQVEISSPKLLQAKSELVLVEADYRGSRAFDNPELTYSEERLDYPGGDERERTFVVSQDLSSLWAAPQNIREMSARFEAASSRYEEEVLRVKCDALIELKRRNDIEDQLNVTETVIAELTELSVKVGSRVVQGDISSYDGARFNLAIIQIAGQRAELQQALSATNIKLLELTGFESKDLDRIDVEPKNLEVPFSGVEEAISFASEHSYTLKSGRYESIASARGVTARKWAMIPNVVLGVGQKKTSGGISGPVIQAQLELPVWNQERREYALSVTKRNRDNSVSLLNRQVVERKIRDSWSQKIQIEQDLTWIGNQDLYASKEQAIQMYKLGESSTLEVCDLLKSIIDSGIAKIGLDMKHQEITMEILVSTGYDPFEEVHLNH